MFWKKKTFTLEEERAYVIHTIRDFLEGTGGAWDWDDFISVPIGYPELDTICGYCLEIRTDYPPTDRTQWCNPDGLRELQRKLEQFEAE